MENCHSCADAFTQLLMRLSSTHSVGSMVGQLSFDEKVLSDIVRALAPISEEQWEALTALAAAHEVQIDPEVCAVCGKAAHRPARHD